MIIRHFCILYFYLSDSIFHTLNFLLREPKNRFMLKANSMAQIFNLRVIKDTNGEIKFLAHYFREI